MFWVVQDGMFQQNRRPELIETLCRFSIPHQVVSLSARREILPDVSPTGDVITNGSVMLSSIALERGWWPGSLMSDNLSCRVWRKPFERFLLNRDAVFDTVGTANPRMDRFFIRPVLDDKAFNGQVMTRDRFLEWQAEILAGRSADVPACTEILYAPVRKIGQEHRHYVVDGEIVSSSRYKMGGIPNQSETVDPAFIGFARQMVETWTPARAFVLDTYVAGDEMGVVELGCICNAGFYRSDIQRIVMALDSMSSD